MKRVIRTPIIRRVSSEQYRTIRGLPLKTIFKYCEQLLDRKRYEERMVAFDWAYRRRKEFVPGDFARFERWLKEYVDDWAACDDLCVRPLGWFLYLIPEMAGHLAKWTGSKNRWIRRASAVALIPSLRKGEQLDLAFEIAHRLLLDDDDLVRKGYGWMLKEASHRFPRDVFRFVMKQKVEMPRTALRYAIEKLPADQRKQAMKRD